MIEFVNSFLSYLMLLLVILACGTVGFFIGGFFRKRKSDNQVASADAMGNNGEA